MRLVHLAVSPSRGGRHQGNAIQPAKHCGLNSPMMVNNATININCHANLTSYFMKATIGGRDECLPCTGPTLGNIFVGFSHGVMVAKGLKPLEYFLWEPSQHCTSFLPPWDEKVPFRFAALSSHWACDNCVVLVLTGISSPAFVFYRYRRRGECDYKWVKQDSTFVDPYGSNHSFMNFSNAIGFEGKFYALSLQGSLAVIEDTNDSQFTINALSKSRAVPSVPCRHFREYLVESCGKILLVFLISRKSFNIVDYVEVFRLHLPKLSWVKMEELGDDRTLFAGANCCMSVSASKVGCMRNCVYFSQLAGENWWVYDMESGCISPGLSNGNRMTNFRHAMNKRQRANML